MTDFKREYLCYPVAEYVPPRCNICGRELHNHHGSRYERCAVPGSDLCLALGDAFKRGQATGFAEGLAKGKPVAEQLVRTQEDLGRAVKLVDTVLQAIEEYSAERLR